jgi:predicted ATPase
MGSERRQRETGFLLNTPFNLMLVAEVGFAMGNLAGSDGLLQEALSLAEATGELWLRPELHRRRACYSLLGAAVFTECAERWLTEALHEARQQGDRLAELRASHDLARLWAEQGRRRNARDLLGPICGWFTGRGGFRAIAEATALLDALS